jgi:hypothetical protein
MDQPDIKGYWCSPRPEYGLVIFGVEHMTNYDDDNAMIRQSRPAGYLFGTWYSVACVEGEMGSQHISRCVPIDEELFKSAKELNWDANAFVDMLKIRQSVGLWVVKFGDYFGRFGSYREVELVDSPFQATLYRRKADADKRAAKPHHVINSSTRKLGFERKVVEIIPLSWLEDGLKMVRVDNC